MKTKDILDCFVDPVYRTIYEKKQSSYYDSVELKCPVCGEHYRSIYGNRFNTDGSVKKTLLCTSCSRRKNRQKNPNPQEGDRFGSLTFIKRVEDKVSPNGKHYIQYLCKCDCGNEVEVNKDNLLKGFTKQCKDCKTKKLVGASRQRGNQSDPPMGSVFGNLTILEKFYHTDYKGRNTQFYRCQCSCGNITEIAKNSVLKGLSTSCGCNGSRNKLREKRIALGELTNPEIGTRFGKLTVLRIIPPPEGGSKQIECKCDCGNIVTINKENLLSGRYNKCEQCRIIDKPIQKKSNINFPQWFIDDLYSQEDRDLATKGELPITKEVLFVCKEGHVYVQKVLNHIDTKTLQPKYGCKICKYNLMNSCRSETSRNKRHYPQWFIDELVNGNDKERAISGELKTTEKVEFLCEYCHQVYSQRISHHINLKTQEPLQKCPNCRYIKSSHKHKEYYKSIRIYPQWFLDKLVDSKDREKCLNGTLKSKDFVQLRCSKGHVYKQVVSSAVHLLSGEEYEGCPKCGCSRSKNELEIEEYIHSLGFTTEHRRGLFDDSKGELDIYIPEKRIAIEYNQYFWHKTLPQDINSKDLFYHQNKFLSCKNKGIHLISIFDVDYTNFKNRILFFLKDLLCEKVRLYARSCDVRRIAFNQAISFYNNYHITGKVLDITISYGLFYNNDLVSCMSFQKANIDNGSLVWELVEFVTKNEYIVIGGASKLLKNFEKEYHSSIIIAFSDNDYFYGNLFHTLGFVGNLEDSPNYYWNINNEEIKKEDCTYSFLSKKYPHLLKDSLLQESNKEDSFMLSLNAIKVYRSGRTHWIKKYKSTEENKYGINLQNKKLDPIKENSIKSEIYNFLLSIGLQPEQIKQNNRSILKNGRSTKELDFYLPEYNLAIEYNGSYFHSELKKPKDYHLDKFKSCDELGIRLISIFEMDWNNEKEKLKDLIKYSILLKKKIPARKCVVRPVDEETAWQFYNTYHIQNKSRLAKINVGLFYNNDLISVMGFGSSSFHNRQNNDGDYELHRFVTKTGITVVGGASKLLHWFEQEYHPKFLLSYSWNDWFNGDLYSKLGFVFSKNVPPDYYWYLNEECINKRQCRIKNLAEKYPELYQKSIEEMASNKEDYIMESLGAIKTYRSGSRRWVKRYS